jgi:hypothetical protein
MNTMFLDMAGGLFSHGDWIFGVIGLIVGAFLDSIYAAKPARSRK